MTQNRGPDEVLTADEVAATLKITIEYLYKLNCKKQGPRYFRLGDNAPAPIRYLRSDVQSWMKGQLAATAAEGGN